MGDNAVSPVPCEVASVGSITEVKTETEEVDNGECVPTSLSIAEWKRNGKFFVFDFRTTENADRFSRAQHPRSSTMKDLKLVMYHTTSGSLFTLRQLFSVFYFLRNFSRSCR